MSLEFEAIARKHFGEPNKAQSSKRELRFGTNGSVSVDLEKGRWYDHEINKGGHLSALESNGNSNGISSPKPCASKPFHIVKTWSYVDELGAELFEVCRLENGEVGADGKPQKTYRQRHRDPTSPGQYIDSVKGIRQVPYRLPELIRAVETGQIIFIVEGEKCVDAVIALGGAATCNAMGAGKWPDDITPFFKNADVVILPDNDEPGEKHATLVVTKLQGIAARVRTLQLPGLSHKGDVANWIEAGGTLEQLHELVAKSIDSKPGAATARFDGYLSQWSVSFGKRVSTARNDLITMAAGKGPRFNLLGAWRWQDVDCHECRLCDFLRRIIS